MRTLRIDPDGATAVAFKNDSAEVRLVGSQREQEVLISYGYFANETEVLDEDTMVPELGLDGEHMLFRQTPSQMVRARTAGAKIRVAFIVPARLQFQGRLEHGTLDAQKIGGCVMTMTSGTARVQACDGAVRLQLGSGTLVVSDLVRKKNHHLRVQAGTIALYAGDLLALVNATVDHGMIQGTYLGKLERIGFSGWRLHPASHDPDTTVDCAVGNGTITLHSNAMVR